MSTALPDRIMDEILTVLALRDSLKPLPGTHAKQDELMAEAIELFDEWAEATWPSASA